MHVPVFGVKVPPVGGHARLAVVDEGAETRYCTNVLYVIHCNYKINRKEGNVLFNDALNTFYLRLYGVRHMVKDHSDSEKGNPLSPHRLLLSINSTMSERSTSELRPAPLK